MAQKKNDAILFDHNHDGIDRRGFLKCMAWAGTGALCVLARRSAEVLRPRRSVTHRKGTPGANSVSFRSATATWASTSRRIPTWSALCKAAVDKINALPLQPEFMLHTGDISHLSKPEEFDTVDQILKGATGKTSSTFPASTTFSTTTASNICERYGKRPKGAGWYSFDQKGVHFVGLVNVMNLKAGGLGTLGAEQLEWLEKDVKHLAKSTPVVVFAHIPLWSRYPEWGWGTEDSAQALSLSEAFRFGHRAQRTHSPDHAKGGRQRHLPHRDFHRIPATASGEAPSPGPMKVPAEQLRSLLGVTDVNYVRKRHALALIDSTLE